MEPPPTDASGKTDLLSLPKQVSSRTSNKSSKSNRSNTISVSSLKKTSVPKGRKVPRILAHYRIFSFVIYSSCIVIFLFYLIYTAILLNTSLLVIQYEPVVKLIAYNSYNLLCPFVGIMFCVLFIYHVKFRVKLEEGDFFGLIGVIIFFCMIMCYDGTGVVNLYHDRLYYLANHSRHHEIYNESETNVLAWQYAWSTKPTCARVHANLKLEESRKHRHEHSDKDESHGPALIQKETVRKSPWMLDGAKGRSGGEEATSHHPHKTAAGNTTVDKLTYEKVCNYTPFSSEKQPSRKWMISMEKQYKCCGPRGYVDWKTYVNDAETTCKGSQGALYNQSCAIPFNTFLASRLHTTVGFMFTLVVAFLVIMFTACCHFAAMKYEDTGIVQEYSLLDLTESDDKTILEIKRRKTVSKLIHSDAVRGILQSSNIRGANNSPVSSAVSFGPHTHINPGHFKNISHTVMSTFGKKFQPDKAKGRGFTGKK